VRRLHRHRAELLVFRGFLIRSLANQTANQPRGTDGMQIGPLLERLRKWPIEHVCFVPRNEH